MSASAVLRSLRPAHSNLGKAGDDFTLQLSGLLVRYVASRPRFLDPLKCIADGDRVVVHKEGDVDGVELVGWFPDGAGHAAVSHAGKKKLRVLVAPAGDPVADHLAEADPFLARRILVHAFDLLAEFGYLGVLRENL